jgi:tyrosyl-tRNA synthetase
MGIDTSYKAKSPALATLLERGYLEAASDLEAIDDLLSSGTTSFYVGFDPTNTSIHIGNLFGVMVMRVLQRHGHRPICLMGGGTARVGDPSGKNETRKMLDEQAIIDNTASMQRVFHRYLNFDSGKDNDAIMVDNADWLLGLNYVDFLREIGRHFSVNRMVAMKTYRDRLENEQPLSFLEFNYQLLQAYDFLHLHRAHGCSLQCGGSDQWGNIIAGVELIRRVRHAEGEDTSQDVAFALTTPLLTTADGKKMGKTERGAVFLDAERVSPFDYYQYWINCHDADVAKLLRVYTDMPLDEVESLTSCEGKALREAKARLAHEATTLAHGEEAARKAKEASEQAFGTGTDWTALGAVELEEGELKLVDLVVHESVKAFKSKREARQRIESGAVKINDEPITDPNQTISAADGDADGVRLRCGKKQRYRVRFRA